MRTDAPRFLTIAGAAICLAAVGCTPRYSLEPGLWELTFDAQKRPVDKKASTEAMYRGPMQVEVVVGWNYDEAAGKKVETVEVWLADTFDPGRDADTRKDLDPLTGTIEPNTRSGVPRLMLEGRDDWHFMMWADVRSPTQLKGVLYGRPRLTDAYYVDGAWEMQKIPDDQWVGYRR